MQRSMQVSGRNVFTACMMYMMCILCIHRESNFGSGVFHIYNSTVATWSWYVDMNGEGTVTDSVTIVHDYTQCPCASRSDSALPTYTYCQTTPIPCTV